MKLNAKNILIPTLVLFIIAIVVTAALAGTNAVTVNKIAEVNAQAEQEARLVVLPDAEDFEKTGEGENVYYVGKADGKTAGYVFNTESSGYGGKVKVMTGINAEGKVTGVVILEHAETPGLGANATNPSFRDQYAANALAGKNFELIKSGEAAEGQILAMTGATITSDAVTTSVNQAIDKYNEVKEAA